MSETPSSTEVEAFLDWYRQKHGRAPRILHIGNIANNAFQNARILNQAGFDCDVMCADYYHIMGCPEWEDADFIGQIGDQFAPDWVKVDLQGYQRPRWFAQGPQSSCLEYLIAKRSGHLPAAEEWWQELGLANRTISGGAEDGKRTVGASLRVRRWWSTARRYVHAAFTRADAYELVLHKLSSWAKEWGMTARILRVALLPLVWIFFLPRRVSRRLFTRQLAAWRGRYAELFPDRTDPFEVRDFGPFASVMPRWKVLFEHYDLIQGYATEGIYPLFGGVPYFAFEHGTIREIPYRQTGEGRRTALTYRLAEHVFVTNFDCVPSAEYLAPGRFTTINHPFDEDHGLAITDWQQQRQRLAVDLDAEFIFFFPTRHDWVKGTGYADKGNDSFLRAFAALRRSGLSVGTVCCEWGANVPQSKALLAELECSHHVKWIAPLPTVHFERMARAAHCVVDQFVLGSFGGVMFKAMAVGAPVLTYLDEPQLLRQYEQAPPVVNCRTEEQIVEQMTRFCRASEELAAIGASAREWMKRYHSKHQTVLKQSRVFAAFLAARDAAAAKPEHPA